jgi:hypothetical protein
MTKEELEFESFTDAALKSVRDTKPLTFGQIDTAMIQAIWRYDYAVCFFPDPAGFMRGFELIPCRTEKELAKCVSVYCDGEATAKKLQAAFVKH